MFLYWEGETREDSEEEAAAYPPETPRWDPASNAWTTLGARAPAAPSLPPCSVHGERDSIGLCDGCRTPFCAACLSLKGALFVCPACEGRLLEIRLSRSVGGGREAERNFFTALRENPATAAAGVLLVVAAALHGWSGLHAEPGPAASQEELRLHARRWYYRGARLSFLARARREAGDTAGGRAPEDGALASYRALVRKFPRSEVADWAMVRIGEVMSARGDDTGFAGEIESFLSGREPGPADLYLHLILAKRARAHGHVATALHHLDAALRENWRFEDGAIFASDAFEAAEAGGWPLVLEEGPPPIQDGLLLAQEAHFLRGELLLESGDRDQARYAFAQAHEVAPAGPLARAAKEREAALQPAWMRGRY